MCCKNIWKRIVPFALALAMGLLTVTILQKVNFVNKIQENLKPANKRFCSGGGGAGAFSEDTSLQIISKPRATYTDAARSNETQGTVKLRVVFQANGQIGDVIPVNYLKDGLTEEAIAAAKQIKFKPTTMNGDPVSVTKQVEYTFTIY